MGRRMRMLRRRLPLEKGVFYRVFYDSLLATT
jgi:hypothetical protein